MHNFFVLGLKNEKSHLEERWIFSMQSITYYPSSQVRKKGFFNEEGKAGCFFLFSKLYV